jgi:hypothetical protein
LVELGFPEFAIALNPLERAAHGIRGQMRTSNPAMPLDGREPGTLKHAHMLRHCGQRHVEPAGELADRSLTRGEASKDLAPRGVGQREERGVEVRIGMVNHVV